MKKTMLMAFGVCLLLVMMASLRGWFPGNSDAMKIHKAAASFLSSDTPVAGSLPAAIVTGLEDLPQSLRGTEVDCSLETDAGGHLKVTIGLRHCFDYFLSAVGEENIDTLTKRIHVQLQSRLRQPALGEAERVLGGYLAYLRGVADIEKRLLAPESGSLDLERARRQMEQIRALRRLYLAPDVIAVFFC